jgi:carbonic anhydrase/acetyltransferase-like protein (isoleucine patch superfamily)
LILACFGIRSFCMNFYPYKGVEPEIHETAYITDGVYLTGDVKVAANVSIWFGTVARGDINFISIGEGSNIQDGSILHVDDNFACIVGKNVVVGHQAVLHGCSIEDNCLIGINAKLLNGSIIREGAMVAAGAVVGEGMEVPAGMLAMGVPAKIKRPLTEEEKEMIKHLAKKYVDVANNYKKNPPKLENAS